MTGKKFSGIINLDGGSTIINGPVAAGENPVINITESPQMSSSWHHAGTDIGVITVKSEEARAVRRVFALTPDEKNGVRFDSGTVNTGRRMVTVTALQALGQGEDAAVSEF